MSTSASPPGPCPPGLMINSQCVAQPGRVGHLATLLRDYRQRNGLTMQAASALVGVARTVWRTWENQAVVPSPTNLQRLSGLLGLTPAEIRLASGPDKVRRGHGCLCGRPHGLAALRTAAGLTSSELARRVHVSPSTITHWESGERSCGWHDRQALSAALSVTRRAVDEALGPLAGHASVPCPGLFAARTEAGRARTDLAREVGVDPATLARWERLEAAPARAVATLRRLLGDAIFRPNRLVAPLPKGGPRVSALARMREAKTLPARVVAGRLGVSPSTVYSWERGTRIPSWADLRRMARMYGRSTREVFSAAGVQGPRHLRPLPWPDEELPVILLELRRWAGVTQREFAEGIGVTAGTVASWERGRNLPSAQAREAMVRWLSD